MGGVLGCLGTCKEDGRRKKKKNKKIPINQKRNGLQSTTLVAHGTPKRETEPAGVAPEQNVQKEQVSASPTQKKVTFNANVKTYEPVLVRASTDSVLEEDRKEFKENVGKSRDDDSVSGDDSITSSTGSYPSNHRYQNGRESDDEAEKYGDSDLSNHRYQNCRESVDEAEKYGDSDPSNHRYQNCRESVNEAEEYGDSDLDDDDGDDVVVLGRSQDKELWPESVVTELTALRTNNSLVRLNSEEVNSPFKSSGLADVGNDMKAGYARDRSTYVHPVLNPVENLTQWKAMKSKGTPLPLKPQKENSIAEFEAPRISFSAEPTFRNLSLLSKPKPNQLKSTDQDVAVNASLSNWLLSPEPTPAKKTSSSSGPESITSERSGSQYSNSVVSFEDRPILGALTVEELRHMSATNSPRKSPTHNPDDRTIIGTVGAYWNETRSTKDLRHMSATNSPRKSPSHSPDDMPILGAVGTYWNETRSTKDLRHISATNSPRKSPSHSPDDTPIIGNVGAYWSDTRSTKEVRRMSATNSPRKSPSHSPDDMVIIGSVGTYWSDTSSIKESGRSNSSFKGIPITTSKYREDNKVKWHSSPFETRLERALNRSGADCDDM